MDEKLSGMNVLTSFVGNVGEWDLSSGDAIEHKVYDHAIHFIALSGARIVTGNSSYDTQVRVFDLPMCLLPLHLIFAFAD